MRYLLSAIPACLLASAVLMPMAPAFAFEELSQGWWVVAATYRQSGVERNDAAIKQISAQLNRCGFRPFNDFSMKFEGFAPGYDVVVTGPYSFKAEGSAVLSRVRRCVPHAYMKQARYLGD